jgi:hypothetical protein
MKKWRLWTLMGAACMALTPFGVSAAAGQGPEAGRGIEKRDIRAIIVASNPADEAVARVVAEQLKAALDAIASGAKLTKADAARASRPTDALASQILELLNQQPPGEARVVVLTATAVAQSQPAGGPPGAKQSDGGCQCRDFCLCIIGDKWCIIACLNRFASAGDARLVRPQGPASRPTDWVVVVLNTENKLSPAQISALAVESLKEVAASPTRAQLTIKTKSSPP